MIQTVITHACSKCQSLNIVRNGTDYKADQQFHCHDCGAYGTLEPQSRSYPEFIKEFVLRAYRERASMRGVERIFGIARQTLARWILEQAASVPDLAATLETGRADDVLELDELWSFVLRKSAKRWIWIALCLGARAKSWPTLLATAVTQSSDPVADTTGRGVLRWERVVARYGNASQKPTKHAALTVISGTLTKTFFQRIPTKCRQRKRPNCSRRTLEQHLASAARSLRAQIAFLLQV